MNGSCPTRTSFSYFRIFILLLIISLLFSACNTPVPATQVSKNTAAPPLVEAAPTVIPEIAEPTKAPATEVVEPTPGVTEEVGQAGWVLVETKYYQSKSDVDILGGPVKSMMTGTSAQLLDYYTDEGVHGNMLFSVTRKDEAGKTLASSSWRVIWTDHQVHQLAGHDLVDNILQISQDCAIDVYDLFISNASREHLSHAPKTLLSNLIVKT